MKKYLQIYNVFFQNAISYQAQYRRDTLLQMVFNLMWVGLMFFVIEILFQFTPEIAGWTKPEMYLLTIIWVIIVELYEMLFGGNLWVISTLVVDGELDGHLTRPANALFMISTKFINVKAIYKILLQCVFLGWIVWHFDFAVTLASLILFFFLAICGVATMYSVTLIANVLAFWFDRIDNINHLLYTFNDMGKYPLSVFPQFFTILTLTVLPIALTAYVPTATLLGKWPLHGVLYVFGFTTLLFSFAVWFWGFAVKRYTSASS